MRIWKKRREGERKETGKYTSVVDLARAKANQQYTENSTGKISPVIAAIHREYKQTWKTLDDELAYALWPGDVDAGNIDSSIHRWAKNEVIDNDREDWKRISASMRKQPDALRYDRQTIFGLVRERPIDIHKDPVALNKYITEYLTTKGVFEDEGTNQSATDTLSSPVPETDAVETAIPDNEKTECKVEVEPSVEREGRSTSSSPTRMAKNTVAQTNFLVWIRRCLLGLLKSRKKNISPAKTVHTQVHNKILVHLTRPHNQGQ